MEHLELWAIVAMGRGGEIGFRGDMPWHIPEDLRHFKALTSGHPVIMGRSTWESLPKKPLPGRTNIVLTRNKRYEAPGAIILPSLADALRIAYYDNPENSEQKVPFIIGGGKVYEESLSLLTRIYVTHIDADFPDADTYFPELRDFTLCEDSAWLISGSGLRYRFAEYRRILSPETI